MKRYQQQMLLPEIGTLGQAQIGKANVLIVGAGGLGTIVASYLVAMGVGNVGIIDFDEIEATNLHRQFFYCTDEVGQKKALILATKLGRQNETISVNAIVQRLSAENIELLSADYTIICDCSDNLETRLLLNKFCGVNQISLVHGAVSEWYGYVTLFHYKNHFDYEDLFEIKTLLNAQTCSISGVSSTICGIIGSLMANETLKIILDIETNLDGGLLYFNGLKTNFKLLKLKKYNVIQ